MLLSTNRAITATTAKFKAKAERFKSLRFFAAVNFRRVCLERGFARKTAGRANLAVEVAEVVLM